MPGSVQETNHDMTSIVAFVTHAGQVNIETYAV